MSYRFMYQISYKDIFYKEYSQYFIITINGLRASLVAQLVKNLPATQETPVGFLDQEVWIGWRFLENG